MSKKLIIKTPITNESEDYLLNLPNKDNGTYTIAVDEDVAHKTGYNHIESTNYVLPGIFEFGYEVDSETGDSRLGNLIFSHTTNGESYYNYINITDNSDDTYSLTFDNTRSNDDIRFNTGTGKVYYNEYEVATKHDIEELPEPMIFKGSVGSGGTVEWDSLPSPAAINTGWTYKAITKHTTAPICEVGDTIISDGSTWWVIPSGDVPDGTVTSVGTVAETNSGLTLTGGPITSSGTVTVGLKSGYSLLNSNSEQTIAGTKIFQDWVTIESQYVSYPKLRLENEKIIIWPTSTGYWAGFGYDSNSTQPTIFINNDTSEGGYQITIPYKDGTIALTSDIPAVSLTTTAGSEAITVNSDSLNVVTTDTTQIISGEKTFNYNKLRINNLISYTGNTLLDIPGGAGTNSVAFYGNVLPSSNNAKDLGADTYYGVKRYWRNLYLANNLTDGTNSITIDQIVNNKSNATNILNDTATGSLHQVFDTGYDNTIDMSIKNPNAWELYQAAGAASSLINKGATGQYATSLGGISAAAGKRALADGTNTIAIGKYSHAEGDNSVTLGNESHAEGYQTVTNGDASHAEGVRTQAIGNNSHAEGAEAISEGENSHAEGYNSIVGAGYIIVDHDAPAPTPGPEPEPVPPTPPTPEELDALNGDGAHAEGHNNFVLGCGAHAEGDLSKAYGRLSHAEGHRTQTGELILRKTEDNKDYYTPDQTKQFQHAEGELTKAIGHASHAGGYETIAGYDYQTAVGKYNANKEHTLFEVGYGWADNERHNALEVWDDGRATVGANPTNNLDVATKEYVDNRIVDVSSLVKKIGDTMTGALTLNNGSAYATTSPSLIFSATDSAGWLYKDGNNLKFTHNAIASGSNYTLTFPTTTGIIATIDDISAAVSDTYSYDTTTGVLTINLD